MKRILSIIILFSFLINIFWFLYVPEEIISSSTINNPMYSVEMKRDLLCIMISYPQYVLGVEQKGGFAYLIMKSGRRILYDDKRAKTHDEKIASSDIQDMMEQYYPLDTSRKLMESEFDPGRARSYPLLMDVYGNTRQAVESNLKNVRTNCGTLQFNSKNGAEGALKEALNELSALSSKSPDTRRAVFPLNGTFNYRNIAGTNLLSPHSFGIAIDLARDSRDYWRWAPRSKGAERLSSYPEDIVKIFEKHNFIWGGKWGHFDILHYEYRPEIICKARYFTTRPSPKDAWYEGVPSDKPEIEKLIEIIDSSVE